jgi:hypothetical protein
VKDAKARVQFKNIMGRIKAKGVTEVMGTRRSASPIRLRSEFVAFSKLPKIDAANKAVTTTKSSKNSTKSETLRAGFRGTADAAVSTWVVAFCIGVVVVSVR